MIKRIFSIGFLACLVATSVVSCNSDDGGVFSKSPIEREQEQQKELRDLLVGSEYGWKFNYFTDESGIGGFTFLMTFTKEGKVTMVSDFNDVGYTAKTSDYELQLRATTSLVFVNKSLIHELSDPINSALRTGKGFEGEFQFRYYGFDENTIFFKGTRDIKKDLNFVRATKEDWDKFENRKDVINKISNEDIPVFRSIEVEKNGSVEMYDATYSSVLRFLNLTEGSNQNLIPGVAGIGVGFESDGLLIQPAIVIDGEKYSSFKWNEATKEFISVNSTDTKVKIKSVDYPEVWGDEYKKYMFSNTNPASGFIKEYLLNAPSNSNKAVRLLTAAQIDRVQLAFSNGSVQIGYLTPRGNFFINVPLTDTGKSGRMGTGTWANSNSVPADIKELHSQLFGYGDLMLKEQRYNVTYTNQILTVYCGGVVFDTYVF